MTLAVMALYADGTSTLRNIASWRVKETDRLAAMATELRKLGAEVEEGPDFLAITPPAALAGRQHPHLRRPPHRHVLLAGRLQPGGRAGAHRRPEVRGQDLPRLLRDPVLRGSAPPTPRIPVICIDGPTASGKGTLASEVARQLGYHYLDSGALYRITALAAVRAGLALDIAHEHSIAQAGRDAAGALRRVARCCWASKT